VRLTQCEKVQHQRELAAGRQLTFARFHRFEINIAEQRYDTLLKLIQPLIDAMQSVLLTFLLVAVNVFHFSFFQIDTIVVTTYLDACYGNNANRRYLGDFVSGAVATAWQVVPDGWRVL
jgi:hypothetical protein